MHINDMSTNAVKEIKLHAINDKKNKKGSNNMTGDQIEIQT